MWKKLHEDSVIERVDHDVAEGQSGQASAAPIAHG